MSYEINIIAINQKTPIQLECVNKVLLYNEFEHEEIKRYAEIWPHFSSTDGVLYSLVSEINEDYYGAFGICDSDFNASIPEHLYPSWISDDVKYNLTPLLIRCDLQDEFIAVIGYILQCAPQKRILFQTRYQGGDEEVFIGVLKMSKFKAMLEQKQILFNVCYIIECD